MKSVSIGIPLSLDDDEGQLPKMVIERLGLSQRDILATDIVKKSIDARKNRVRFLYTLDITVPANAHIPSDVQPVKDRQPLVVYSGASKLPYPPVVIGAGPCGLMAALVLAQQGYKTIVLERGGDVEKRKKQVERFFNGGMHDGQNNVLFGDGGAGTFSDGKLTARRHDAYADFVLRALIDHGAPDEIRYVNKPHLGTDVLTDIVQRLKRDIIQAGGQWINGARVDGFCQKSGSLTEVLYTKDGQHTGVPAVCAILAIGHSARDTYAMLRESGIAMAFKPFAVGLRIEHPQHVIDRAQYGSYAGHEKLGAADYALTAKHGGRGVYTFCMCPGGMVIPSISEAGHLCVNGMSGSTRDGQNANAAVVVQVSKEDCGQDVFAGIEFQRHYEKIAYGMTDDYAAPVQRLKDFLLDRKSTEINQVVPSYPRGYVLSNLRNCLPPFAYSGIAHGIGQFDRNLSGFAMDDAVLTGVEMRTSAPVRIIRREDRQSEALLGLYPAGEGAGYAGGIISAAADGIRSACSIASQYAPLL